MPKFLFTGKLSIKKKNKNPLSEPACPLISQSAWFMVVTVSLSGNVSQKRLWVIVILQGQPGMTRRRVFSYLQQSGVRATASGISYFLLFGRKSILDVQAQTLSSSEVSRFSCSASTAPSRCFRRRKPSFAWFCFGFCFCACCRGRLCCLAQSLAPYLIFGIRFPVCLHVTDLLCLMPVWAWQVIYFCCFELLSCHIYAISSPWVTACLLKNKALLNVTVSSATITPLLPSENYFPPLCFSLLDPGSKFHMFCLFSSVLALSQRKQHFHPHPTVTCETPVCCTHFVIAIPVGSGCRLSSQL